MTISGINLFSIEHSKLVYLRMSARAVAVHCCHAIARADCRGMCGSWAVPRLCSRGQRHPDLSIVSTRALLIDGVVPQCLLLAFTPFTSIWIYLRLSVMENWDGDYRLNRTQHSEPLKRNQINRQSRFACLSSKRRYRRCSRAVDTRDSAAALLSAECWLLPIRTLRNSDQYGTNTNK